MWQFNGDRDECYNDDGDGSVDGDGDAYRSNDYDVMRNRWLGLEATVMMRAEHDMSKLDAMAGRMTSATQSTEFSSASC